MKKIWVALFVTISLSLCGCAHKSDKITVDYEQAEIEFDEYIESLKLPTYFAIPYEVEKKESRKFDVTGDGYDDLLRFPFFGSGQPRQSVSVYDPVNHVGYFLDGFQYSYSLESCTEDELLIRKYRYSDEKKSPIGTLVIEDDKLLWVEK